MSGDVCLYGAGGTGRRVAEAIGRRGGHVRCFLDRAANRIEAIGTIPVLFPFSASLPRDVKSLPVVVAVFNRDTNSAAIAAQLREAGFDRVISYPEWHRRHYTDLGDDFWLGDPGVVARARELIEQTDTLWEDEASRLLFRQIVALYQDRDLTRAPVPTPRRDEYLATDVPGWPQEKSLRLIDCGAFDGDTLEIFRVTPFSIEAAACFEPDPANFRRLQNRINSWAPEARANITLWPCATADRSGQLSFSAGLGESSHLAAPGDGATVTCVAIDDVLADFSPNLMKLDIEGAEEPALKGARRLIAKNRPALAVAVYHRPEDLWRLPSLMQSWDLGYRFFLRSYGFNGFDTTCYAIV